ncbi:MAG TPA: GNAT family N-acetyltransferase [Verrucomicrobiae bacterium]|nr:GNAT family N-acetyltransferase [Verrucomicrobiae bacterium]
MIEIRQLNGDDAMEWSRLRLEGLQGDPYAFSSSPEEHQTLGMEEIKKRLGFGRPDSFVIGAFESRLLVGMAGFQRENGPKRRHKGMVWGVYVTPAKRGQGVGRKLLQEVLGRAAKVGGLEQIMISVTTTQEAAVALYRSLGFESFGREPNALKIGESYVGEEHMTLRNSPRA